MYAGCRYFVNNKHTGCLKKVCNHDFGEQESFLCKKLYYTLILSTYIKHIILVPQEKVLLVSKSPYDRYFVEEAYIALLKTFQINQYIKSKLNDSVKFIFLYFVKIIRRQFNQLPILVPLFINNLKKISVYAEKKYNKDY